jgi:SRSO17 transposase
MSRTEEDWRAALASWLSPFLQHLGHKARRRMCPVYVAGLIGAGERKSLQPIAARLAPADYDQLHHFVCDGVWDPAPLEGELLSQADQLVGGSNAVLVIDDTALPKKGTHSVGVTHQYAGVLGKKANCQVLVSLTLARDEVPVPIALRLFLPETWTKDRERLQRAGVPDAFRLERSKPEIALAELDRALKAGVRFSVVVADAGYGISAEFRQALSARGLLWAVGIPRIQKVYAADVELTWPVGKRGAKRTSPVPNAPSTAAEDMLAGARWRTLTWRRGTKGPLKATFAAMRVRVADGPAVRMHGRNNQHLPGEEVWLVGERRSSGERKYYLSNLPPGTALKRLASTIKARWVCEQAHQQLKEELGLDHFEGRSWQGLHRHALMSLIAFCFLQQQRLVAAQRGKKVAGATAAAEPSGDPTSASRSSRPSHAPAMPLLPSSLQPASGE